MNNVVRLSTPAASSRVHRLLAALPNEEAPLALEVSGSLAAAIRRAAGWAGRAPDQQAIAALEHLFGSDGAA